MPNPIPGWRREQVKQREMNRCIRCHAGGSEWHHRRGRRVRDQHTHCSCNGVWLCHTCHMWVHTNPMSAMAQGFMVSRYIADPAVIPVVVDGNGWLLDHEGDGKIDVTLGT